MPITQAEVDDMTNKAKGQEIETTSSATVAVQDNAPVGVSGEADPSDFAIPYVTLVQASSDAVKQRKAQAGAFLSSDGAQYDVIDFVPLHIAFTRDFYDKEGQKNICGSRDRITGYPADVAYFSQHGIDLAEGDPLACRSCPFAVWAPSTKMSCLKGYTVTCYDLNAEQPFMFRVRGTAVNPFKNRLVGAVAMGRAKPWGRQLQMSSKLVSRNGNSWFVPELEPTKGFNAEEQAEWETYAAGIVAPAAVKHDEDPDDIPF